MPPDPPSFQGFLLFVTGTPARVGLEIRRPVVRTPSGAQEKIVRAFPKGVIKRVFFLNRLPIGAAAVILLIIILFVYAAVSIRFHSTGRLSFSYESRGGYGIFNVRDDDLNPLYKSQGGGFGV